LRLFHPTERFDEFFEFGAPVETVEPLLFLLRRFVDQLSARLEPAGLVAETLVLKLALESGKPVVQRLQLPQPTRAPEVLFRILFTSLETLRTDAPIQSVGLTVLPTAEVEKQLGLFETILSDPHQFQETLARLGAALGSDRVGTPALDDSHRPDAFHMTAPDFENAPVPLETPVIAAGQPVPIRRFRPALKIEVECESADTPGTAPEQPKPSGKEMPLAGGLNHRPISIRCAMIKGKLKFRIGPWRTSGNWWDPCAWEREEWDAATTDGRVLRLVRQTDGWFVEGMVD
jgi:protein ImuB